MSWPKQYLNYPSKACWNPAFTALILADFTGNRRFGSRSVCFGLRHSGQYVVSKVFTNGKCSQGDRLYQAPEHESYDCTKDQRSFERRTPWVDPPNSCYGVLGVVKSVRHQCVERRVWLSILSCLVDERPSTSTTINRMIRDLQRHAMHPPF